MNFQQQNTTLPQIDPNNPMNSYYFSQVEAHARRNPHDQNAQLLYVHWIQAMQTIEQMRNAQTSQSPNGAAGNPISPPGVVPIIQSMPSGIGAQEMHANQQRTYPYPETRQHVLDEALGEGQ